MERKILYRGEVLTLIREGHWEYVERVRATGAAIIAAVTPANEVLIVEQYRIPVGIRTLELPAGIIGDEVDKTRETHEEAAIRELLEETGWSAGKMKAIMTGAASSGVTSEVVTVFLATELEKVHAGGGVGSEEITVHQVPLSSISDWLREKAAQGFLVDPKLYTGLYFLTFRG